MLKMSTVISNLLIIILVSLLGCEKPSDHKQKGPAPQVEPEIPKPIEKAEPPANQPPAAPEQKKLVQIDVPFIKEMAAKIDSSISPVASKILFENFGNEGESKIWISETSPSMSECAIMVDINSEQKTYARFISCPINNEIDIQAEYGFISSSEDQSGGVLLGIQPVISSCLDKEHRYIKNAKVDYSTWIFTTKIDNLDPDQGILSLYHGQANQKILFKNWFEDTSSESANSTRYCDELLKDSHRFKDYAKYELVANTCRLMSKDIYDIAKLSNSACFISDNNPLSYKSMKNSVRVDQLYKD